jgi:hypothetical protein
MQELLWCCQLLSPLTCPVDGPVMEMVGLGFTVRVAVPKLLSVQSVTPAVACTCRLKVPAEKLPLGVLHVIMTLSPEVTANSNSSGQQTRLASFGRAKTQPGVKSNPSQHLWKVYRVIQLVCAPGHLVVPREWAAPCCTSTRSWLKQPPSQNPKVPTDTHKPHRLRLGRHCNSYQVVL